MSKGFLPPLLRAAIEVALEDSGVEHPRVSRDGLVTEILPGSVERTPLSDSDEDAVFLVQSAVIADVILELLTGETFRRGEALLQALNVDGAKVLYEKRREDAIAHGVTSQVLRDVLFRSQRMIGPKPRTIKMSSRKA